MSLVVIDGIIQSLVVIEKGHLMVIKKVIDCHWVIIGH